MQQNSRRNFVCKHWFSICTGFGLDRVKILHISPHGALVWFCAEYSVDNTEMFPLLLSSAYTESRAFPLLAPPITKQVGGAQKLEGDTADQRDIPHHTASHSVTELKRGWQAG